MTSLGIGDSGELCVPRISSNKNILGLGNPLLDVIKDVDSNFVKKYKLEKGGFCFYDEKVHSDIYSALQNNHDDHHDNGGASSSPPSSSLKFSGGATQNTMRILAQLVRAQTGTTTTTTSISHTGTTLTYSGCVGKDSEAEIMKKLNTESNLNSLFAVSNKSPSGICGVSLFDCDRSMVTRLGAAVEYPEEFMDESPEFGDVLKRAGLVYSAAFFLTSGPKTQARVMKFCAENHRLFSTGLSAPFICESFTEQVKELVAYSHVVTGNETEWKSFGEAIKMTDKDDVRKTLKNCANAIPKKFSDSHKFSRIFLCTRGCKSTLVLVDRPACCPNCPTSKKEDDKKADDKKAEDKTEAADDNRFVVEEYPVDPLSKELVVDPSGAGDAFMGGFLLGLVSNKPLQQCIEYAHMAARSNVQLRGVRINITDGIKDVLQSDAA